MMKKETIQSYLNNFRRHIYPYLKPNVGIKAIVYPCNADGAIIKFSFGENNSSSDEYEKKNERITAALKSNNLLRFFEKEIADSALDTVKFKGTNYIIESRNVILIKDSSPDQWNDKKSEEDVKKLISTAFAQ